MSPSPRGTTRERVLRGGLMVCGTTSDAGKSTVVAGLCRLLARQGVSVAPFKAQNMSLNSVVTPSGHEIGRAQGIQAHAAGIPAEVAMNPVLLKPTAEHSCQIVLNGVPWKVTSAQGYQASTLDLLPIVLDALAELRSRFDVVLCEGAGSPAEINLLDRDIVNLRVAYEASLTAIVVGDINPGGVFAALYGTVALLPDHLRACVRGLVINKLRGDPALLLDGCAQLTARTGVPVLGVIPWLDSTGLDAEDSMALDAPLVMAGEAIADELDVAVVRFPHISNFTDLDPLSIEAGVRIRYVHDRAGLGAPDLVILPGSKSTVDDLSWLRRTGIAAALDRTDAIVLGVCGGYQMMGRTIDDPVESEVGVVDGLAVLPVTTHFEPTKITQQRTGRADGAPIHGYQIHHGRVRVAGGDVFVTLSVADGGVSGGDGDVVDGVRVGRWCGTTLHGLFEADDFRRAFLHGVAAHRGKRFASAGLSFAQARIDALDHLADVLAEHLDMPAIERLINAAGAPRA